MKLFSVSLLLALLTACIEEPLAPVPRLPRAAQEGPVVITGRIVSSSANIGLESANLWVIEAGASVASNETGHYRIVLPARFRGEIVPINARRIGFRVQKRTVRLDRDTVTIDFAMAADTIRFDCALVIVDGGFVDPGLSGTKRPAMKVKRAATTVK